MASAIYEKVLEDVRQLSDGEQHQLLRALLQQPSVANASSSQTGSDSDQARVEAWQARWDTLARRIGDAWIDPSVGAVDAVREQRREL